MIDTGCEFPSYLLAEGTKSPTQVNILQIHDEVRIESSNGFKIRASHQHCDAGYPLGRKGLVVVDIATEKYGLDRREFAIRRRLEPFAV